MFNDTSIGASFSVGNVTGSPTKQTARKISNCIPMCIGDIVNAVGEVNIHGTKPHIISVVGILRSYDLQRLRACYVIEDHTGSIEALMWVDSDASTDLPKVKEGHYVKAFATIRVQDDVKNLAVLRLAAVEHPNEITTHLLEVLHAQCYLRKKGSGESNATSMGQIYSEQSGDNGLSSMQNQVIAIVKTNTSANGINLAEIYKAFPSTKRNDVQNALESLLHVIIVNCSKKMAYN